MSNANAAFLVIERTHRNIELAVSYGLGLAVLYELGISVFRLENGREFAEELLIIAEKL